MLFPDPATEQILQDEAEELIATCMHDRGFEYTPEPFVEPSDFTLTADGGTYGYGIAAMALTPTPPELPRSANAELRDSLTNAERSAWDFALGGEEDGCTDRADREIAKRYRIDRLGDAMAGYSTAVESDPELEAVQASWSDCMRRAGYAFWDRNDATSAVLEMARAEPVDGAAVAEFETAVATQDATCAADVDLDDTVAARNQQLIDEYFKD